MLRTGIFFIAGACTVALAIAAPSRAQFAIPPDMGYAAAPGLPGETEPLTVAMMYYRFSGLPAPFESWARMTDGYKNTFEFDKASAQEREADRLRDSFRLLTYEGRIVVRHTAVLSDYSLENEGYVIESFGGNVFFPFTYGEENYAVIPQALLRYQWLGVTGMTAKNIYDLRQKSESGKDVPVIMTLRPLYADKGQPVEIEGKKYRLIGAEISKIGIYDENGAALWEKDAEAAAPSATESELLKLYR